MKLVGSVHDHCRCSRGVRCFDLTFHTMTYADILNDCIYIYIYKKGGAGQKRLANFATRSGEALTLYLAPGQRQAQATKIILKKCCLSFWTTDVPKWPMRLRGSVKHALSRVKRGQKRDQWIKETIHSSSKGTPRPLRCTPRPATELAVVGKPYMDQNLTCQIIMEYSSRGTCLVLGLSLMSPLLLAN